MSYGYILNLPIKNRVKQDQKFKISKSARRVVNQRGQAAVEYVLLLVVIVSMVIAAKGLFQGADTFIKNYVGDYFVCLMDYGELPTQSVSEADLKTHTTSSKCKVTFSIAKGATLVNGGSSQSGAGSKAGQNSSSAEASKKTSASGSKNKNQSTANNDSSSGTNTSAYANGRITKLNSGSGTSDGPNGSSGVNKSKIIEGDQASSDSIFGNGSGGSDNRSDPKARRYKAIISGQMYTDIEKNSKNKQPRSALKNTLKIPTEEGLRPGPRKNAFIPPERKPAATVEDAEANFSFGNLMKWLMIAGMVIAIIIFFGGQIMNYSNSE